MTCRRTTPTGVAPDMLTVEEAARVVRIGRSAAYKLAGEYLTRGGAAGLPARGTGVGARSIEGRGTVAVPRTAPDGVAADMVPVEEAARVVRIGPSAAYKLAGEYLTSGGASGLPARRIGGQLRVPRQLLEEYIG